jgi:sRNA-binding carbon storage regulator CsrA
MLILAVEEGQSIVIDGHIVVRLVGVRKTAGRMTARLGVTAPTEVPVNREAVEDEVNPGWRDQAQEPARQTKRSWEQRRNRA